MPCVAVLELAQSAYVICLHAANVSTPVRHAFLDWLAHQTLGRVSICHELHQCFCTQVSKAVYASTTKSQLNLDKRRANDPNPTVTYPDISFAVDNFEEAFESLVCFALHMSRLV